MIRVDETDPVGGKYFENMKHINILCHLYFEEFIFKLINVRI